MKKKFRCLVCGYVYEGENPPAECPVCHAKADKFVEVKEADHAARFAELLGEVVWDTETNVRKRMEAEAGACEDKFRIAKLAKAQNLDAIHDTVHEMAKDEARHGAGFQGLYNRYFKK